MAKLRTTDALTFPMAPMLDVVFQILIYFVFTYRTDQPEAHLAVNLPSPGQTAGHQIKLLELKVEPGQVSLQNTPRSLETIQSLLTDLAKLDAEQTVIVKMSPLAKTEELVKVLDVCKGAGFARLNVVTLR